MINAPSIPELESRMRPGAYSTAGFLGQTESLETVLTQDRQTLKTLGISYEQIAGALENVLQRVQGQRRKLSIENCREYWKREEAGPTSNVFHFESISNFSVNNLPNTDVGYLVESRL